ncbi:DUF4383 domain-containing protein [Arthrobacter roseus]|uniref:DUF4383 domain-containing protein n=1 Tax=Arthrobacter roseus TaxID=136274 RepID=UPI001965C8A0|nr:DUF4383 domain-containing protein [Arthrobacter roseus]MBM7847222.1 uncharacterized membrane protein YtjA (UPF0391 family) [Arthrobacter roseus]
MATTNSAGRDGVGTGGKTALQKVAMLFGVVFLLVGILGFIPGITQEYSELAFAGPTSGALLLGIFQVSILHNIVHLLFGAAGVAMARTHAGSFNYLLWGGLIYLVLFIYGLVVPHDSQANFVPLNAADNWLHIVLTIAMIAAALGLRGTAHHDATTATARRP